MLDDDNSRLIDCAETSHLFHVHLYIVYIITSEYVVQQLPNISNKLSTYQLSHTHNRPCR